MKNFCPTFLKNRKGNKVETWYTHGQWNKDQGPITHGFKSLHRFYIAMLPYPTEISGIQHEFNFKIYQSYGYFSSDSSAAAL